MSNPRPEKAAVVADARKRFESSAAALMTEYSRLDVAKMSELRRSIRAVGGEYKVYKNTMVRLAVADLDADLSDLLTGPTAIAFVGAAPDGAKADPSAVAKALRDFSRANRSLVLKGGVLGDKVLTADDLLALADLPSREALLAQLAGALAAPASKFAGLLSALPRNFAFALQSLIESRSGEASGDESHEATADASAEPAAADEPSSRAEAADAPTTASSAPSDRSDQPPTPGESGEPDPSDTQEA